MCRYFQAQIKIKAFYCVVLSALTFLSTIQELKPEYVQKRLLYVLKNMKPHFFPRISLSLEQHA